MFNTISVKTDHMIWRSRGTSLKTQMIKVMFNCQKGTIKLELQFYGMNLLSTFCTLWKVLLLLMNSYFYFLNHFYNLYMVKFYMITCILVVTIYHGGGGGMLLPIQQQFLYTAVLLKFIFKSLSRSDEWMPLWNFDF